MVSKIVHICALSTLIFLIKDADAQTTVQRFKQQFAQSSVWAFCWGEFESTCKIHPYNRFFKAPYQGMGGFNNAAVCRDVCGRPQGQGCALQLNYQQDGNCCGYAWVTVSCFP